MAVYPTQNYLGKGSILLDGYPNPAVVSLFRTVRVKCQLQESLPQHLLLSQSLIFKERNLPCHYFTSSSSIFSLWIKPAAI